MSASIIITTPRLTLSIPNTDDALPLSEAYAEIADNPFWQMSALSTIEGARDVIAAWVKSDEHFFIVRHENQIVGSVGLQPADGEDGHYTITYWIRQSAQGSGYATEAANALVRYAFSALKARSVMISYDRKNLASRRVIEKLGFVRYAQEIKQDGSVAEIFRRTNLRGLPLLDIEYLNDQSSDN